MSTTMGRRKLQTFLGKRPAILILCLQRLANAVESFADNQRWWMVWRNVGVRWCSGCLTRYYLVCSVGWSQSKRKCWNHTHLCLLLIVSVQLGSRREPTLWGVRLFPRVQCSSPASQSYGVLAWEQGHPLTARNGMFVRVPLHRFVKKDARTNVTLKRIHGPDICACMRLCRRKSNPEPKTHFPDFWYFFRIW